MVLIAITEGSPPWIVLPWQHIQRENPMRRMQYVELLLR